jgi:hypothetical protein
VAFALFAVLGVLALFVLHGPAAGVAALAALLTFVLACIQALRRYDTDDRRQSDRAAVGGWFGGWF